MHVSRTLVRDGVGSHRMASWNRGSALLYTQLLSVHQIGCVNAVK